MDTNQIERAVTRDPCAEAIFHGVYARDQLPNTVQYPCAMVLNTDPANKPGEHWVAMYFDEEGHGEYFDSYGIPPPPCFTRYIQRHSMQWSWNRRSLQDVWTSACGHFCVYYVIYRSRDIPMNDITQHLHSIEHNDQYVMEYVNALL